MKNKFIFNEVPVELMLMLKPDGAFAFLLKYNKENGLPGYYCLTANNERRLAKNLALIDIYNYPETAVSFLEQYEIADFCGSHVECGFNKYPIYNFREQRLREIDNSVYEEYLLYYSQAA